MKKMTKQEEQIVKFVQDDFATRQYARKPFETQWLMNMNFYMGNQFCNVGYGGEIEDLEKQYFWQEREIFNHIAPVVDVRLAKLGKIKPTTTVLPASNDEKDVFAAKVSKKILDSTSSKLELNKKIIQAMQWSEICGTSFYKVTWNPQHGQVVAEDENGNQIRSGEVEVTVCSPFEIYPDSFTCENLENCQSIIHARAMDVGEIKNLYGIDLQGEDINIFSLSSTSVGVGGLGYSSAAPKISQGTKTNSALVLERYEKPSKELPNGRLTIVVGDYLFFDGDLPYENGADGRRTFPFVKQVSLNQVSSFWGVSVIDRLIPVQRAYNSVKNRKHEFMNRLTMGVLTVEDGSIDIENLEDEGLCPGKILVYRQGASAPEFLNGENLSNDFAEEEDKLLTEFKDISGVNQVFDSSMASSNLSGTALELMLEQDELRLNNTADNMKDCVKNMSQMILNLYKQFAIVPRLARIVGDNGEVELFYFNSSDISSDDIELETQNDLGESVTQRRQMVFDLIEAGLMNDEDGQMSNKMKVKALQLLGLGVWENAQDTNELHIKKADNENLKLYKNQNVKVCEIDEHELHIDRHIAFMLGGDYEEQFLIDESLEQRFLNHINQHKKLLKAQKEEER